MGFAKIFAQERPAVVEFTKDVNKKPVILKDTIPVERSIIMDSANKPYLLKLDHIGPFYQSTRIIISFTNHSSAFIDNFWVTASLLDKRKSFLYRDQPLFFTKVKQGETAKSDIICESIGIEDIGYIVLSPMLLEVNDEDQIFDIEQVEIKSDTLDYIIIEFESRLK
jgi:hypothetical protein